MTDILDGDVLVASGALVVVMPLFVVVALRTIVTRTADHRQWEECEYCSPN